MEMNIQNENIRKFLEKASEDPELRNQLAQLRSPEEAYEVAASMQEGFTKEEFVTEMRKLYESNLGELSESDLSDDDLENVAGGGGG